MKYEIQRGGWCSEEARGPYGMSLWRNIRIFPTLFPIGLGTAPTFASGIQGALKFLFLEFYSIARNKEALVSDYLDLSNSLIHWNPSFVRVAHNWELESLDSFLNLLYSSNTHLREVDSMLWTPSCKDDLL